MNAKILASALVVLFSAGASAQKNVFKFSGTVKDSDGKGIANVVVNNGVDFTSTDKNGKWALTTDTNVCKFVSISTPAGYVLPQQDGIAHGFYARVDKLVDGKGGDFVLEKRKDASDKFYYISISDPQVRTDGDMDRWRNETVEDLKPVIDSLKRTGEVIGMALGDIVFDNMGLYDDYVASVSNLGMTMFQCIGNHDFEKKYQDLHNMPLGSPVYGEMYYHRYFGPTDYSFNIGKAHFVTLKDINYVGGKRYVEALTGAQIDWLKKDLSYVPKGALVILNMHAAGWNTIENDGNVRNSKELAEVLKGYNVHVFTGHTHFLQNCVVNDNLYEHNIGAACGAWWSGWVNRCGTPNGYMIVDVDGNDVKWRYKATRSNVGRQMTVYGKGDFRKQEDFVVANVWDWDKDCKVEWTQDGKPMGKMEQFTGIDEKYVSGLKKGKEGTLTEHLFRARPTDGAKEVKIVFTNRFGDKFEETVKLN